MTSGKAAAMLPQQSTATSSARPAISVQGAIALHVHLQHTNAARYVVESDTTRNTKTKMEDNVDENFRNIERVTM
jgi:hypothetical protein